MYVCVWLCVCMYRVFSVCLSLQVLQRQLIHTHSAFYLWDIFCLIYEFLRVSFLICHSIFIVMWWWNLKEKWWEEFLTQGFVVHSVGLESCFVFSVFVLTLHLPCLKSFCAEKWTHIMIYMHLQSEHFQSLKWLNVLLEPCILMSVLHVLVSPRYNLTGWPVTYFTCWFRPDIILLADLLLTSCAG